MVLLDLGFFCTSKKYTIIEGKRPNNINPAMLKRQKKHDLTHSITRGDREGKTSTSHTH
jgi:hypothetical protein